MNYMGVEQREEGYVVAGRKTKKHDLILEWWGRSELNHNW